MAEESKSTTPPLQNPLPKDTDTSLKTFDEVDVEEALNGWQIPEEYLEETQTGPQEDLRGHRHYETTVRRHPGGLRRLPAARLRVGDRVGPQAARRRGRPATPKGPQRISQDSAEG